MPDVEIPTPARSVARLGDVYYFAYGDSIQVARIDGEGHRTVLRTIPCFPLLPRLFVSGTYLLAPSSGEIRVFSLADPTNPVLVNQAPAGTSRRMCLDGDRLYIEGPDGIGIYSLLGLPNVIRVGTIAAAPDEPPLDCTTFTVAGGIFFGVNAFTWLYILDVRDPFCPRLLSLTESAANENWQGELGYASGCLFFSSVSLEQDILRFSVKIERVGTDWNLEEVSVFSTDRLVDRFVAAGEWMLGFQEIGQKVHIFELTTPGGPAWTASWPMSPEGFSDDIQQYGVWLDPLIFIFFDQTHFQVIDAESLPEWRTLSSEDGQQAQYASRLYSDGQVVAAVGYLEGPFNNTWLFRLTFDGALEPVATMPDFIVFGLKDGVLYAGDTTTSDTYPGGVPLHLFDVSDPDHPTSIGLIPGVHAMRGRIQGDYAILQDHEAGVILLDVRDARQPMELFRWKPDGSFRFWDGWVDGTHLYVTDIDFHQYGQCVWVIDFTDPAHFRVVQQIDNRFGIDFYIPLHCLVYRSQYLLVNERYCVDIIDITELDQPRLIYQLFSSYVNSPYGVEQIVLYDHYLFGAWRGGGIWIHDLETPWTELNPEFPPSAVGHFPTYYCGVDLWVGEGLAVAVTQPHVVSVTFEIIQDGDVDENGIVDEADLLKLKLWLSGMTVSTPDPAVADLNRDGRIDAQDALRLALSIS